MSTVDCTQSPGLSGTGPITVEQFRAVMPFFADITKYPDSTICMLIGVAVTLLNANIWGALYQWGMALWVAHELYKWSLATTQGGSGIPGSASGPVNSKSVGPVSLSYDTMLASEDGAGQYNLTMWGQQFYHYAKLVAIGKPVQVNTPGVPPDNSLPGAWAGPWEYVIGIHS